MLPECPKPAALTDIPASECPFRIDQVLKLLFQRKQAIGESTFEVADSIKALATWTAAKNAVDSKKIVVSPILDSLVIPSSEAITEGGGDNSTPFGLQLVIGEGQVTVTGQFRNLNKEQIKAMRKLSNESLASLGAASLTVFMVNLERTFVHATEEADAESAPVGFDIFNFRLGSTGSEGFNQDNKTPFSFSLLPNWDERLSYTKPNFDPMIQI